MYRLTLGLTLIFTFVSAIAQGQESYEITLHAPNYTSGRAYLTYHMGKNLNVQDSAEMTPSGTALFKGSKRLPGGIYAIVFPGKSLSFDFLIDKNPITKIQIQADTANLMKSTVTGSSAHTLFQQYQLYVASQGRKLHQARMNYNSAANKADSLKYEQEFTQLNQELMAYRDQLTKENPESMMAALLQSMKDPQLPNKKPLTRQDSLDNYYYYKSHYWDGVTFMDERIIRTPFFIPKLERYYRDVVPQVSDSIIKDFDYKMLFARNEPELYKFLLNWATDEYINPKIMGQDAVFVHLFEKYHSKGLSPWLNEKQMETITKRAYMQMANLIGEKAANLEMTDSLGKARNLYDVQADYTVVIFWDPNCGHCKEEVPRIDSVYHASWKSHGVKLYGVMIEPGQVKAWVKYTKENKLNEWIHVYQTKEKEKAETDAQRPSFRQLYDVTMTPTIYLLDKEKRIIGKKLSWKQLHDFLQVKWKEKTGK